MSPGDSSLRTSSIWLAFVTDENVLDSQKCFIISHIVSWIVTMISKQTWSQWHSIIDNNYPATRAYRRPQFQNFCDSPYRQSAIFSKCLQNIPLNEEGWNLQLKNMNRIHDPYHQSFCLLFVYKNVEYWSIYIYFFFFFFWIWVLRPFQEYFTYIKPIAHQRWAKTREPGEKPPDHP